MKRWSLAAAAAVALVPAFTTTGTAFGYVAPGANVVSASLERLEQADDATSQIALSGDGRYAAIGTRARNFFADDDPDPDGQFRSGGIFRRDLVNGGLELVAHGELRSEADPDEVLVRGAINPSLSHDGRFVVFSTGAALTGADTNGNVDVYLRDMTVPIRAAGAFELISRSSNGAPARYAPAPEGHDRPGVNPGTDVTARHAISADARFVAFKSAGVITDLPAGGALETPANQLFVRDRASGLTQLVTRDRATGAPAGGARGGAAISADGTTVAWSGQEAPRQTALLASEGEDTSLDYYFWRRIADGDAAVTRRVTGFADPADPFCAAGTTVLEQPLPNGPCYGPLATPEGRAGGLTNTPPVLSADGRRVAFLTTSGPRGLLVSGTAPDLFVVDVQPGVALRATTVELTRDVGSAPATNAPIDGFELSADGRWIALTTLRTQQLLGTLRAVGSARSVASVRDLYLADLQDRTIERVTHGYSGDDANGSVAPLPAIDAAGRRIGFLSAASNMFFGDANGRQDAFFVDRLDAAPAEPPAPVEVDVFDLGPAPAIEAVPPIATRVTVRARRGRKGVVQLRIKVPEAASGMVRAHGKLRTAAGKRVGKTRVLGRRSIKTKKAGTVTVKLAISKSLVKRLRRAKRLTASARVELTGASGKAYVGRATIEFRR